MKSVLPEWYGHDDEAIGRIVKEGTVAFDANALLHLYRLNKGQRKEILKVIGDIQERVFIPFQVAWEYQKNRLSAVAENEAAHEKLTQALEFKQTLVNSIQDPELRKQASKAFLKAKKRYQRDIAKMRDEHTLRFDDVRKTDPVRDALDELLGPENIGKRPSAEDLKKLKATANERIKAKIPPGFGDEKEKDDPTGDYIVWSELLEYAKSSDKPMLFVTNDEKKGDWYRPLIQGQAIGPLPALIAEMGQFTTHPYHQVTLSSFLWLANKHLGSDVEETTISTVEKTSIAGSRVRSIDEILSPLYTQSLADFAQPDYSSFLNSLDVGRTPSSLFGSDAMLKALGIDSASIARNVADLTKPLPLTALFDQTNPPNSSIIQEIVRQRDQAVQEAMRQRDEQMRRVEAETPLATPKRAKPVKKTPSKGRGADRPAETQ